MFHIYNVSHLSNIIKIPKNRYWFIAKRYPLHLFYDDRMVSLFPLYYTSVTCNKIGQLRRSNAGGNSRKDAGNPVPIAETAWGAHVRIRHISCHAILEIGITVFFLKKNCVPKGRCHTLGRHKKNAVASGCITFAVYLMGLPKTPIIRTLPLQFDVCLFQLLHLFFPDRIRKAMQCPAYYRAFKIPTNRQGRK